MVQPSLVWGEGECPMDIPPSGVAILHVPYAVTVVKHSL